MNIDVQRAVVRLNVEVFEKGKSYANMTINITFKAKMKVFKDDLIDTDYFLMPPYATEGD